MCPLCTTFCLPIDLQGYKQSPPSDLLAYSDAVPPPPQVIQQIFPLFS